MISKELHIAKITEGIEVLPLLQRLETQPELWDEITARQDTPGSPHSSTRTIFLRWSKEMSLEAVFNSTEAVDYPALSKLPEAQGIIREVMDAVGSGELGRVLIVELGPWAAVDKHADTGVYADHFERFHVPLAHSDGSVFYVEDTPGCGQYAHMRAGEVFWFNHKKEHFAVNDSDFTRIHMIIDCVAPKYRRERDEVSA